MQPIHSEPAPQTSGQRQPMTFVILSGIVTTFLALAGVYWTNQQTDDFQIMGWYANYVIPLGAIIVGLIAGSGYALASWFMGVRATRAMLLMILGLQTCGYVAAEYVEYHDVRRAMEERGMVMRSTGELPTFLEYYHDKAMSFAWKPKNATEAVSPMGAGGYFFVLLGAVGFIVSGLIAPAGLRAIPFCPTCERYMSRKILGRVPASVPVRKVKKKDIEGTAAYEQEQAVAAEAGLQAIARLESAVTADDVQAFQTELAIYDSKAAGKLPQRIEVGLAWCSSCGQGHLRPALQTGQGKQLKTVALPTTPASRAFVNGVLGEPQK